MVTEAYAGTISITPSHRWIRTVSAKARACSLRLGSIVRPNSTVTAASPRGSTAKPFLVGAGRKAVGRERVMIAVENETDRIDQRPVEVEQHGTEGRHGGNVAARGTDRNASLRTEENEPEQPRCDRVG